MKLICIGRNYVDHAKELNNPVPKEPVVFMKPSTAMLKDGKPFFLPEFSIDIHYEGEIVFKIGKNGKHIEQKFARNYLDEVTIGIDFTARDLQQRCKEKGLPWEIAKAFDHSAVLGRFIPVSNITDINAIPFSLLKNNTSVQQGNTQHLIFPIEHILAYISQFFTLQKGDLIFTGTPVGVGSISIGDVYEGYIGNEKLLRCEVK